MSNQTKIENAFAHGKALVTYLMAGDPNLARSADYIIAAQEAGADLIEIGLPFSDPIAEGPVIQEASVRALEAGTVLPDIFKMVKGISDQIHVPLVFMTYINPVFVYGYDRFFAACVDCGICGIIVPDLPYEEQQEVKSVAKKYDIAVISLIAPTSEKRIAMIAKEADGFVYVVSSMGVTGVRSEITTDIGTMVKQIRSQTSRPAAVGFGISTPEQAKKYAGLSDGVIVGSAIVRLIATHGENADAPLREYISSLKNAIR